VVLSGAVDIIEAAALWRRLLDVADHRAPVEVDLHACADVDTAVLQLLLALRRRREAAGRPTTFVGGNARIQTALARFGVESTAAR
jgi:ABC-type transporter Mla MlaB component